MLHTVKDSSGAYTVPCSGEHCPLGSKGHHTLAYKLVIAIDGLEAEQAAMRADKPNVTDGHSDGKRVRYVRREERIATLRDVLAMLAGGAA